MRIHLFHHRKIIKKALSQLLIDKGYKVYGNGFYQTNSYLNGNSLLLIDIDSLLHIESPQLTVLYSTKNNIVLLGNLQQLNWLFKFSSELKGFICKSDSDQHLYKCIEKLNKKECFLSKKAANFIREEKFLQQKILFENSLTDPLTKTELKVMLEIGNGKTTNEIAEEWHRSHHTVNNHRKSVKKKFKTDSSFRLSRFCFKKLNAIETLIALQENKKYIEELVKND